MIYISFSGSRGRESIREVFALYSKTNKIEDKPHKPHKPHKPQDGGKSKQRGVRSRKSAGHNSPKRRKSGRKLKSGRKGDKR